MATFPLTSGCNGSDETTSASTTTSGGESSSSTGGLVQVTGESSSTGEPVPTTGDDGGLTTTGSTTTVGTVPGETTTGETTVDETTTGGETTTTGGETTTTGDESTGEPVEPWDPEAGWTVFEKSADTQTIYVSKSTGSDQNDGKTEATAVQTIAKGRSLMRDKFPDWMLLRRGDVWTEGLGQWTKSGRSAAEPMLVSTFGDKPERPLLKTGAEIGLYLPQGKTSNFVSFVGLHLYAHTRDPDSPDYVGGAGGEGVRWVGNSQGMLLEDMVVQFYEGTNVSVQGNASDFRMRRSIVVDSYALVVDDHSQGVYLDNVNGALLEGNVIDHNGWNADAPTGEATIYNHDIYIQVNCKNTTVIDNIITRAASHGLQARAGGTVGGNLFVDNPTAFSYGLVNGDHPPLDGGVSGDVFGNVIRDGGDITAELPRGLGIKISNIKKATFTDNVLAHDKTEGNNPAAIIMETNGVDVLDLTFADNIIYDWRGGILISMNSVPKMKMTNNAVQAPLRPTFLVDQKAIGAESVYEGNKYFSISPDAEWFRIGNSKRSYDQWVMQSKETGSSETEVQYPDPERTIGDYHASIGEQASFTAFLAEARKQSHKNYRQEYTAKAPITYIRAGFGLMTDP